MVKGYYVRCHLGSSCYCWVRIDQVLFECFYYDDSYCRKGFFCVRNGIKREYYTFYKERSNGLAYPNSIVKFMVIYE